MNIFIVEDDPCLLENLRSTLRRAGFLALTARNSQGALQALEREEPRLVMLDLTLPKPERDSIFQHIHSNPDLPVLLLANAENEEAVIESLDLGAEDYIFKPFRTDELAARVRVALRHCRQTNSPDTLKAAGLRLDCIEDQVHFRSQSTAVRLTPLESRLLQVLMLKAGQIVSYPTLMEFIWGPIEGNRTILKQLVYRLRGKLKDAIPASCSIKTVSGVGYGLIETRLSEW